MAEYPSYPDATALAAADTWLILKSGGVTEEVTGLVAKTYLGGTTASVNVKDPVYGAVGNHRFVTDGVIASGSLSTLTSATAVFTSGDVGRAVTIERAGVAGVTGNLPHSTTISAFTNATTVTLAAAAPNTAGVTAARVDLGTDDSAAFQAAITAAYAADGPKAVFVPPGSYMVPATLNVTSSLAFRGAGRDLAKVVHSSWSNGFTVTAPNGSVVEFEDLTIQGPSGVLPHQGVTNEAIHYEVSSTFDSRFSVRRVNVVGTFDSGVGRSGGGLFELIDCHLEGTDVCASAFESTNSVDKMFVFIRGCTMSCPAGDFTTQGSVGLYIHPHVPYVVTGCRFLTMGRYGIYENGTHNSPRRPSIISGCEFVNAEIAKTETRGRTNIVGCSAKGTLSGLGSVLYGHETRVAGCTFENCGPQSVYRSVSFAGCTFVNTQVSLQDDASATFLGVTACRFKVDAANAYNCIELAGAAAHHSVIDDCDFEDITTTGSVGRAIYAPAGSHDATIKNCRFRGFRDPGNTAVVFHRGVRLRLEGCEFDNRVQGSTNAVSVQDVGALEGASNVFLGTMKIGTFDGTNQQRLVRRPGVNPTAVASAATIDTNTTAWLNYDTHVVTGSAAIATLSNPWVAVGAIRLVVAAGGTWSTPSSGNITPLSTAARSAGQVVTLLWEPTVGKWLETGTAGGSGDPTMGGDLTGTASDAQYAAGAIVNADINASAGIALSKLATDPLARANHTGTQTASTVSDFNSAAAGASAAGAAAVGGDLTGTVANAQYAAGSLVNDDVSATAGIAATKVAAVRSTFSNAAYTVLATDRYVGQTGTLTVSRAVTLPAANAVPAGTEVTVADESGTVTTTNTLVVTRAGSDTINGQTTLTLPSAYAWARFVSDGTSKWSVISRSVLVDSQVFTASGTWTKPAWAGDQAVTTLFMVGVGGGGGSGRRGAALSARGGGGGGQGGGHAQITLPTSSLSGTATVTVPAASTGGAAVTADDTNGNTGNSGGTMIVTSGSYTWQMQGGASGGSGTTGGGAGGSSRVAAAAAGGSGGGAGGAATPAGGGGVLAHIGAGGGGGGGGLSSGNVAGAGGAGGLGFFGGAAAGTGGAIDTAGTVGGSVTTNHPVGGTGGGGGGSSVAGPGGAGGAGGNYGAGGGGGGASVNGQTSGAGGASGPGIVVIVTEG